MRSLHWSGAGMARERRVPAVRMPLGHSPGRGSRTTRRRRSGQSRPHAVSPVSCPDAATKIRQRRSGWRAPEWSSVTGWKNPRDRSCLQEFANPLLLVILW